MFLTLLAFSRHWPEWSLGRTPWRKPDETHRPGHESRATRLEVGPLVSSERPRGPHLLRRPALQRRCSADRASSATVSQWPSTSHYLMVTHEDMNMGKDRGQLARIGAVNRLGHLEGPRVTVGVLPSHKIMPGVDLAGHKRRVGRHAARDGRRYMADRNPAALTAGLQRAFSRAARGRPARADREIEDRKLRALVREMLNRLCFRDATCRIETIYAGYDGPAVRRRCWSVTIAPNAKRAARGSLEINAQQSTAAPSRWLLIPTASAPSMAHQ
jgi:hypothetical protein